jgi:hypothetical protein
MFYPYPSQPLSHSPNDGYELRQCYLLRYEKFHTIQFGQFTFLLVSFENDLSKVFDVLMLRLTYHHLAGKFVLNVEHLLFTLRQWHAITAQQDAAYNPAKHANTHR